MSDIFLSYASQDRKRVKPLVIALKRAGWTVWWDRQIPAGKTFRQVITEELDSAKCVIVIWSKQSVNSNWVLEEAEEGHKHRILLPVLFDDVPPPLGFRNLQAADLTKWDGENTSQELSRLISDAATFIGSAPDVREDTEKPSRRYGLQRLKHLPILVTGIAVFTLAVFTFLIFVYQIKENSLTPPTISNPSPEMPAKPVSNPNVVHADIFYHQSGFTRKNAERLKHALEEKGIPSQILPHRDPRTPDAIFIGALVSARKARIVISMIPYDIKYIFRPDYPAPEGGDPDGLLVGVGYMSTHYKEFRGLASEPVNVSAKELAYLTEPGLSNADFQRRLREITKY